MTTRIATACLLSLLLVVPGRSEEKDPRGILRKRTARWYHELPHVKEDETEGAESNPTGSPIAGGKGYRDMIEKGTFTARTPDQLKSALGKAKSGDVVFLPGTVEIDLSGEATLAIPGGVTLASTRGQGESEGARLFSTNFDTPAMIESGGDHGRVTGLRLEGPHKGRRRVPQHSRGIRIRHFGFEIDNCELWGFSHAAVHVVVGAVRAYIHHCYIHHNIRDGLGYGVCHNTGTSLIEACRFDHGRHYTAATGASGEGYEARYNVFGPVTTSHMLDMHGGRDRGDGTDIAGDWIHIHHNTFLNKNTIKIRGKPNQFQRVHNNRLVKKGKK